MTEKMELIENFIREGKQINPILLDTMTLIARNKLNKRRNINDKFELLETSPREDISSKEEGYIDNFDNFVKKIDEFIASIKLDDMLVKPYFFLDYNDKNIQDYLDGKEELEHIFNNENGDIIDKTPIVDKQILGSLTRKIKKNGNEIEIPALETFSQKKKFYDVNTDFIAKNKIFNEKNQTTIFYFQYLVNNLFNKMIDEYSKQENLIGQLYFIFKGGTSMKIMYEKYKKLLKTNGNLFEQLNSFFGRSDSDYAVLLNDKINKKIYNLHYYKLNIVIYNCLKKINEFINNNLEKILPLNTITIDDMKELLKEYNKVLKDDRGDYGKFSPEHQLTYFDRVKEIIGVRIYDKVYVDETKLPTAAKTTGGNYNKFNLFMTGGENDVLNKFEITHLLKEDNTMPISDLKKKKIAGKTKPLAKKPIQRQSFYITLDKNDDNKYVSSNVKIRPEEVQLYDSGIYQYANETNRYIVSKNFYTYFTLHRVKINIILYYKTFNDKIGQFRAPAELIDVPITLYEDYKSRNLDFGNVIKKYIYTLNNKSLEFYSYSLYGFIDDIYKALYVEQEFPWRDVKYDKKINRMLFLLLMYCLNNFNNVEEIIEGIKKYTDDINKTTFDVTFQNIDGTDTNKHVILDRYISYNNDLKDKIKKLTNTDADNKNKEKYNKYKDYINGLLKIFKMDTLKTIETDKVPEDVNYLQKYLKYKHKYLSLKNKSDK